MAKKDMNTEVRGMMGEYRSGPLPDYDHRTRLLVVRAVVLDRA
jgi:hypothetical protein